MGSRTVYKYELKPEGIFQPYDIGLELPVDAKLVLFDTQEGRWFVWFEIDTHERVFETRVFTVVGTGHSVPDSFEHRASFQVDEPDSGGTFVWHLYERTQA
jgi:hypothetical protein